jgi:plastocyanin
MRVAVAFSLLVLACGGSSSPQGPVQLQITAAGINPRTITIPSGVQVSFVNKDAASHQITSSDCAELSSPMLTMDQSFTVTLTGPKTCNFNDSVNQGATFAGTVTVLQPGVDGGSGY